LSTAPRLVPDILVEHVRLPDLVPLPDAYCDVMGLPRGVPRYMEAGLYDAHGRKLGGLKDVIPETRVVVEFAGVSLIWGVFEHKLRGGFRGDLFFDNVPGTAPTTSFFNEWDTRTVQPVIGDALFELVSSERGRNVARVCAKNCSRSDLTVAAGFIISLSVEMPPVA
jgi:hypothetical protein